MAAQQMLRHGPHMQSHAGAVYSICTATASHTATSSPRICCTPRATQARRITTPSRLFTLHTFFILLRTFAARPCSLSRIASCFLCLEKPTENSTLKRKWPYSAPSTHGPKPIVTTSWVTGGGLRPVQICQRELSGLCSSRLTRPRWRAPCK